MGKQHRFKPKYEVEWPRDDPKWLVTTGFEVFDGAYRNTSIEVRSLTGEAITGTVLMSIPVTHFVLEATMSNLPVKQGGHPSEKRGPGAPRGRRQVDPEAFAARCLALFREGVWGWLAQAADEMGVGRSTAKRYAREIRELGLPFPPRRSSGRKEA